MTSPALSSTEPASADETSALRHSGRRPWTAAAGAGYVVLSFTGLALAPLPDLGATRGDVQAFLDSAAPARYLAGGGAEILAYVCLVAFVVGVVLGRRPGRRPGPGPLAAAGATLAAGTVATGIALEGGVVLSPAVPVTTAQALLTAGSVATWLSLVGIAMAMAGLAAAGRDGTGLPVWACWSAAVIAAALLVALPLAATPVAHIPATVMYLWVLVVAVLVLKRRRAGDRISS